MADWTSPTVSAARRLVARDSIVTGVRTVPEEVPIALTYGRTTYAVMMATPSDIADFAIGFSLTEGIVERADDIVDCEIVALPQGFEARMSLSTDRDDVLRSRARRFAGPAGCGLCGIESLEAATKAPASIAADLRLSGADIFDALGAMRSQQVLNAETRAVHAAGFYADKRIVALREDVGRHNALDKLAGALARSATAAASGFIVMSSRLSIELVQKAAATGCPVIVAVSAPTAYALRAAEACGMTVVAVARDDSFEIFSHPERIEV